MKGYLVPAFSAFGCLVGVALAGSAPDSSEPVGCHGSQAAASCHAEAPAANCHAEAAESCHGRSRSTFSQRRAARVASRSQARADRASARSQASGCHGQQVASAPACSCAEDCACRN